MKPLKIFLKICLYVFATSGIETFLKNYVNNFKLFLIL